MTRLARRDFLATAALASIGLPALAQETRLTLATTMPPGAAAAQAMEFIGPWMSRLTAASKGSVAVQVRDGPNIATLANSYDRVMNDVVQIAWSLQPMLGGKFPLSEVAGLPFLAKNCETASVALWRLYKSGLIDSEYQDIVPLWFGVSAASNLHLAKPLKTLLELDGLKVNVFNRGLLQVVERFKGTGSSVPPEQVYEALQRGNLDGMMTAWSGFNAYKLGEVTQYHVMAPFGSSVHMFFMSKKKFQSLPADAQKAITEASGEEQSRLHGKTWDHHEGVQRGVVEATGKHKFVDATPAQLAEWKTRIEPLIDTWVKSRPSGDKVLAKFRELLAQAEVEKK